MFEIEVGSVVGVEMVVEVEKFCVVIEILIQIVWNVVQARNDDENEDQYPAYS